MNRKFKFTEGEEKKIHDAVENFEKETSGEIVPYFAQQSDRYIDSYFKAALLSGAILIALFIMFSLLWKLPFIVTPIFMGISILAANVIGIILTYLFPSFKRLFTSESAMEEQVRKRASEAFIQEEVFNTKERIGILLFISNFERQVFILADSGINEKIERTEWQKITEIITENFRLGNRVNGIVKAIHSCGEVLIREGFKAGEDDSDELSNELRKE